MNRLLKIAWLFFITLRRRLLLSIIERDTLMLKHIPFKTLGKVNHGWLRANHHFSFGKYYNPQRMGFGKLRVVNDDFIAAGGGFEPHPHNNMEIITYVRSGAVAHQDNVGNKGITKQGQVQVMSAGSGIVHSEHNRTNEPLTLYQIWIETNQHNAKPKWDTKNFPQQMSTTLPLLVSGYQEDKDKALHIHQQARIFGGKVAQGTRFEHDITNQVYILASNGMFSIANEKQKITLNKGDAAEVVDNNYVVITALTDCEIVVIDAP